MRSFIVVLTVLCLTTVSQAGDQYDIKVYPAPRALSPIVVDGVAADAAWDRAPLSSGFTFYNKPEVAEPLTSIMVAWDETNLYLMVTCQEPNIARLTPVNYARDSSNIFHGEAVEIFIDPEHSHNRYYQIAVNAAGNVYDSVRTDPSWNARVQAAVQMGDDYWTLEVAVPWADMEATPKAGQVVGLNVCRDRYLGANKQWTNWAQTAANFHDPERFGHIVLSPDARRLGELEAEYRKGERIGPIVFCGPPALTDAAYRMLVTHALADAAELLDQIAGALGDEEEQEGARAELDRRLAAYRAELAGFTDAVESGRPLGLDTWRHMTGRIASLGTELDGVIWEARLAALLSSI